MKKQLALAIAAACYSAGALAAVQVGPQGYTPLKPAAISDKASRVKHAPLAIERFQADPNDDGGVHRYIIQLASPALPNYTGGISGLTATNIQANRSNALTGQDGKPRLNVRSQASLNYRAHLMDEQQRFIGKASQTLGGSFNVLAQTQLALNGMIVEGTQAEMMKLAKMMDVRSITRDKRHELHTDRGPGWIGANKVWDGTVTGVEYKGEGIIVGILDTGVDTNSRSFAATGDDGYTHINPYGEGVYKGDCLTDASLCNAKLVGVYSWPEITDEYQGEVPANGQDYNGHGSHTAGTTAGNVLYDVPVLDADGEPGTFSFDQISGVAPHANVVSFQTCLPGESDDPLSGCFTSLAVLSVEAAIADNISVLNYSVGGSSSNPWNDSESIAFLNARAAGIHVATSAGNDGPGPATVGSPGDNPWLTSVGAFTHDRDFIEKSLTLSGGDTPVPTGISGKSITGALAATPLVYAGDFDNANDPDNDPAQCLQPFPEGTFNGEIVICDRGEIARVAKGQNVAAGGAAGFILANLQDGATSVVADAHVIPALHIDANDGDALKAWLATGDGHTAAIPASTVGSNPNVADIAADFTSRGPNPSVPDVLVPHVAAPGVSIYAAYAPTTPFKGTPDGAEFAFLSGTSMASPHVAGALALIAGTRPDWTPAEAQSALMLTATQAAWKEDGSTRADFFDMGAGRIRIDKAINSPLVLDESRDDYLAADPAQGGDPSQINMASLAKGDCIGSCSWTRTVKATQGGSFTASGVALDAGMTLSVEPASFTLAAGESQTLQITADVMDAKRNDWNMGNIELSNGSETLRMPVVAFASTGNLPDHVAITAHRDADSILLPDITAVAITDFTVTSYGLTKADLTDGSLAEDSDLTSPFDDTTDGVEVQLLTVAEGSKRMVAEILASSSPDLDLFVGIDTNGDGVAQQEELLAYSATSTSMEKVDLASPQAGDYWILVQNYAASAEGASDTYTLATALVDGTTGDNLTIEGPAAVGALETFDLRILWNDDMMEGDRFYGAVELGTDANDETNLGMMRIDLVRGEDDVVLSSSLEDGARVEAGDPVNFTVTVRPNLNAEDRSYDISLTVPDGIILDEASLPEGATVSGSTLTLPTVLMPSLAGVPLHSYAMTSNADDASCVMPDFGQGGGYVDLETLIEVKTNPDLEGDNVQWGWDRSHEFLGQQYDSLYFGDDGFITFSNSAGERPFENQALPDMIAPNNLLAFLWRDGVVVYDEANNSGVTLAAADGISLIEYDNLVTYYQFTNIAAADMVDVEILLMPSAGEGPEIIVAFDNVVHQYGSILGATIGYEDATGTAGDMMVYHAFNNPEGAIGDLNVDIQDGTLLCFDQQLNIEPTEFNFSGTVAEDFAGGPISMVLTSETDADGTQPETNETAGTVEVEGAPVVTIAGSKNATLTANERTTVTLAGEATDPNGDALTLSWSQISGPAATLSGATQAQARVELPAVEGRTELVFQLTASDGGRDDSATITVTVNNTDDDGGSLGWLVLLLAPLAAVRRRSH
ncbi:S8 family serine peptidase [Ferrimonas balearica]|uniref:S8 family serine peptidase n=1 Tax=Ferrimonas balearica TaxID=44012 RepID=UPI001C56E9CC|nr:S8 family serine peptidase [Ferrimonas balearica]MBW3165346.1 S8 family serine peptidase [Ferrimonas balearica]